MLFGGAKIGASATLMEGRGSCYGADINKCSLSLHVEAEINTEFLPNVLFSPTLSFSTAIRPENLPRNLSKIFSVLFGRR